MSTHCCIDFASERDIDIISDKVFCNLKYTGPCIIAIDIDCPVGTVSHTDNVQTVIDWVYL